MSQAITIIGAGPYGLSAAAHLRRLPGTRIRLFGRPMSFWEEKMPKGMLLRSGWRASYIADPDRTFTLKAFQTAIGTRVPSPVPLEQFTAYGRWFQEKVAPDLDPRFVSKLTPFRNEFVLTLEDGETLAVNRVIVATGIEPFAQVPPEFSSLPRALISHSSDHQDFCQFKGKSVAVIGGGQSALESAALLREAGATVQVFVRERNIHFLGWRKRILHFKPLFKLLYSWTDVGPAGLSQLVSHPQYFRAFPHAIQDPIARRCIRPAGAGWLIARLKEVEIYPGRSIQGAQATDSRLNLQLSDGTNCVVDHLLMGTGYKIDIAKYRFLSQELVASILQVDGYPVLNGSFEASVPGLHFLGAPAAWSFGPLMRFVAGTEFGCARLTESIGRTRAR